MYSCSLLSHQGIASSVVSKVMAEFDRKLVILILTFWIFVPTLDMVSDMTMVIRLFRGPEPDLFLSGGKLLQHIRGSQDKLETKIFSYSIS